MTKRQRSLRQPSGRARTKPGVGEAGEYYHVEVRDKSQFSSFRTHDIGEEGHTQRVAGHRPNGSWDTQKWLIHKDDAYRVEDTLETGREETREILDQLGSRPHHVKGDIFRAKPRPNIPEKEKPTEAQKRARQENIKKAQRAARGATDYEERTYQDLYELAQERDISGRSKMNKKQLIRALREER